MAELVLQPFGWERIVLAVQRVRERVLRAATALEKIGIPYCVIGDNAIEAHVRRADESAVRTSKDVEFLIRRAKIDPAKAAFDSNGIESVRFVFAGEFAHAEHVEPAPNVMDSETIENIRILNLTELVRMKLVWFRDVDRMHLRDLIEVGLVDQSWTAKLPEKLATRLQMLLDTPDG
jgi:hypothetical protein